MLYIGNINSFGVFMATSESYIYNFAKRYNKSGNVNVKVLDKGHNLKLRTSSK